MTSPAPCIAVVDDEPAVRTAVRRLLRLAAFDVTTFPSGEAFLASLASATPACALLDLHMAGIPGLDVLARLRVLDLHFPVICITASDELGLDDAVLRAGARQLLRKPFSNAELLGALGAALPNAAAR